MSRVFNALNGDEIRKLILREVEQGLSQYGELRPHITFPVVRWNWQLHLEVYPRDPKDILITKGGEVIAENEAPTQGKKQVLLKAKREVEAPDLTREQGGLPVPQVMRGPVGTHEIFMQPRDSSEVGRGRGAVIDRRAQELGGDKLAALRARGAMADSGEAIGLGSEMTMEESSDPNSDSGNTGNGDA